MIQEITYNRKKAVDYALRYAFRPNPQYPYYAGNDCTNFISQCLKAGGAKNHFHKTHPWWCVNMATSICWSVAHSLYWYIKISTKENIGIIAKTVDIDGDENYYPNLMNHLEIGDLIQYYNEKGYVQHSTIITGFKQTDQGRQPLVTHHTYSAKNITWRKGFKRTIFHHIEKCRYQINTY